MAGANPDDAAVQGWLGYCLLLESRNSATPEEAQALRKRAREAGLRARELGSKWPLLNDLFTAIDTPAGQPYSSNAEASARMKEGERAFGKGEHDAAPAAYVAALKIDPKLYCDALMAAGRTMEARDKFIEAVIAQPSPKPWAAL